jgi:spore coat polysaccharide biosynthesis predicted glycosyltransferase SpsG
MDYPAWICRTKLAEDMPPDYVEFKHIKPYMDVRHVWNDAMPKLMVQCQQAIVHLGMTCWELAYLGIPQYIFTRSENHLIDAKRFEDMGLARAFPRVGLPDSTAEWNSFIDYRFIPDGKRPDGKGAQRFLDALK